MEWKRPRRADSMPMSDSAAMVTYLFWISVLLSIVGVLLLPVFAIRVPQDYFSSRRIQQTRPLQERGPGYLLIALIRNGFALVLFAAGIIMLFTPGQGILMLLVSLSLASFPGKRALERKLIGIPGVIEAINSLRVKAGQPPLRHNVKIRVERT